MIERSSIFFILLFAFLCTAQAQQGELIDKVIGVVGNEIVLYSDVQKRVLQARQQGMPMSDKAQCFLLEEVLYEELLSNPNREIERIIDFLKLEVFLQEVLQSFGALISHRADLWKERYTPQYVILVQSRIGLALKEICYVRSTRRDIRVLSI